ncbi:protein FAF-like, chloroplastic [Solanum pennellii]|uniref:Protein FAF-like, chloroplastic n=1 Tax=Solanum pennellii TaxID=28526 RepID=A0ABM1HH01_SOLPN|nr:protein FAF-like, chloroplastic [Solanum pennellii]
MSIPRMEEMETPHLCKPPTPHMPKTKGIMSILGLDTQRGKSNVTSIRRTFSADMSSKQWLTQNGFFSPIKKIASSKDLALSTSSEEEEEEEEEEELARRKTSFDVWSLILSQKKNDDLQTPYIHPLVKRSTSSLSEKSLEICTENLGSENGSDGFSSYAPSENEDVDKEKHDHHHHYHHHHQYCSQFIEELRVVKYNNSKRPSSSFPPPITSLARGDNKPSIQMQSRRQDGKLILDVVSIPHRNNFHAHRLDGRLLLTLVDNSTSTSSLEKEMEAYGEDFDQLFDVIDDNTPQNDYVSDDCLEKEEEEKGIIVMEQNPRLSSGVKTMMRLLDSPIEIRKKSIQFPIETKFPKISLELKDHLGLGNKTCVTWSKKFSKVVNLTGSVDSTELTDQEVSQIISVPQSTTASFNAYEYFWRKNPTIAEKCNNYTTKQVVVASNSTTPNAKSTTKVATYMNYLVPLQRGCKEQKRSLLIWEPYCIATS